MFSKCTAERNRITKFALYERLCEAATLPVGGVWPDEPTSALRDPRLSPLRLMPRQPCFFSRWYAGTNGDPRAR